MENMTAKNVEFFEVTQEFKKAAVSILGNRPFAEVTNQMAVLRKETTVYHIDELNLVVGYLGELPYSAVAGFFDNVRAWIKEYTEENNEQGTPLAPVSKVTEEVDAAEA